MKDSIKLLKSNLKELALSIKNQKILRKKSHPHHSKYIGDWELLSLRYEFRHKHVAYCLSRGRKLEQIDSGYKLDMEWVGFIIKTMQPESKEKLYVVVNKNLTTSQQAVQSAHAVAEFLRKNPYTQWKNGHLILLKDTPGTAVLFGHCEHAAFREPDLENKVTAYAMFGVKVEQQMKNKTLL